MTWYERWGVVLGSSLVMWAVSERAFWSMMRPDENVFFIALGLLPYFIATYLVFLAVQYFKVSTLFEFVLMGALYGWLIEGIVAMTLFGSGGIVFPITISWTGLAWHMLLSVVVMLFWHHRVLARSFLGSAAFAVAFGLFWGIWSMTWFFETPPVVNPIPLFAVHAGFVVALMMFGHWLLGRRTVTAFLPPRMEWIPFVVIAGLYFCFVTIPFIGVSALVLPLLFLLLAMPLLLSRKRHDAPHILPLLTTRVSIMNLASFILTPVVATILYALMTVGVITPYPVNMPIFIATSIVGVLVLVFAWLKVLLGKKSAS